jgi:mycofactocin system glycosyltransferase
VVVPVRDRHAELARCLAGLAGLAGAPRVIVVDDGSGDPRAVARIATEAGASVLRRPVNGGPAAARNTGLAAADTPLVAFLDSDCVPRAGWLDRLLPHFADPAVGAVAPRIVPHENGRTWLARYEGASSTLDMGARPSIVRPGSRVPYVPGAALVVRKAAAGAGFAEDMQVGEDVDFIWRLAAAGWRARYEPAAAMGHQHRVRLREWLARRKDYGTSAAALELRHPGSVRPLYASPWTAVAWLAVAVGRPDAGAVVTGTGTALLARRLAQVTGEGWPRPASSAAWRLAAGQAGGGTLAAVRPLGSAVSRTWWPLALPAAMAVRRFRLPLAVLVLTPPLLDWLDRRPPLDPARYVAARLLDDIGYSLGVWQGCAERRTARPLLPLLRGRRPDSRHLPGVTYPGVTYPGSLVQAAAEFGRDDDVVGGHVVDRGPAEREQGGVDTAAEHVEDVLHARGSVGGEPPQVGPADHDRPGTEGQRLDHVAAAPDAAVQQHLDLAAHRVADRRQRPDGGRRAVQVVAAVVGHRDRGSADVDRPTGVVGTHHALDHERAAPLLAQPGQIIPGGRRGLQPLAVDVEERGGRLAGRGHVGDGEVGQAAAGEPRATATSPSGCTACTPVGDAITGREISWPSTDVAISLAAGRSAMCGGANRSSLKAAVLSRSVTPFSVPATRAR